MLNPDSFSPEAVIIGNGEFPDTQVMDKWLLNAPYVVCCDGAANRYLSLDYRIDLIIGDGDSILPELAQRYASILQLVSEQEMNDLSKAVRHISLQGKRRVVILGGCGLREDHTIGNISLLIYYLKCGITAIMPTNFGIFIPCHDDTCFATYPGQQISVFNHDATNLKAEGLYFPLREFDMLWQGTLNQATSNSIHIHAKGYYLLYFAKNKQGL